MHLKFLGLISLIIFVSKQVTANNFLIEEWVEQGRTVNLACKSEPVLMYQQNAKIQWKKDGWKLNQTDRISIDDNNNVEILDLQHDDRGTYDCEINHGEDEKAVANTVYLHFGSTGHAMGESDSWLNQQNEVLGLDNILVVSLMLCITMLVGWTVSLGCMRYKSRSAGGDDEDPDDD
ncbi:uncharacterized protein [Antedon mediterranea]|uniref:uncharacterized protein n=1 Tax=Antedon mediterranea TaxID=105859 RepID=UPI003AF97DF2